MIEELDSEIIAEMPIEELIEFLQDKGKTRFAEPEDIAKYLQKLARNSNRLDKMMADPINLSLPLILSTSPIWKARLNALIKK